jgi:hypothetical protein
MKSLSVFGLNFDPFEHLDSTKDVHLQEYLIIPEAAKIALSDQPVAICAQPGGGKSALRIYTANFYRDSRGVRFAVTYIPESYSSDPRLHFEGIMRALARAVFMYLVSYPDLFFVLGAEIRQKVKRLLMGLPYGLPFNLDGLLAAEFITEIEQLLGVSALSGLQKLDKSHRQLAQELARESSRPEPLRLEESFELLRDAFGAKSIHILVDGLDGFVETRSWHALIAWIRPLLEVLNDWDRYNIYLKFFLPMDISETPALRAIRSLRTATLEWDDNLLASLVRRRIFVASGGNFDSLDALSAPDIRNVELTLVRQLEGRDKLPRQIIRRSKDLLQTLMTSGKKLITSDDLISIGEEAYVAIL